MSSRSNLQEKREVIKLLLAYGLPPLPVAPRSSNAVNGKCPSYLDKGKAKLISHSLYRDNVPDSNILALWFSDQRTGIGTLGLRDIVWIDIDRKNFDSQDECDSCYNTLLQANPDLNDAWLEQTHSGGYRIGLRVATIPTFTKFKLGEGKAVGELLHSGSFTVLAPTVGISGNTYRNINRPSHLPLIDSVESLGILPLRENKVTPQTLTTINFDSESLNNQNSVNLIDCISKNNRLILEGDISPEDDRSLLFSKACKDLLGWETWLNSQSIQYVGNCEEIAYKAGRNIGFNDVKIKYILRGLGQCSPALLLVQGESACISKVEKLLGIGNFSKESLDETNRENWNKSREFKALKKVAQTNFEFPKDTPKNNAIIAVKSGLGTGKTAAMLAMIEGKKTGAILIGYRNNLLFQTISRAAQEFIVISHINEDGIVDENEEISLSCCINSGHKLSGMFKGRDVYFDEIESVIKHLVDGGTFTNFEQKRAMNIFQEAVRESNRVFLLDGNLTSETVNFIHQFATDKEVFSVENTQKIAPHNIYFCDGFVVDDDGKAQLKPRAKSHLISHLSDKETVPFIATDSKKFAHELQEYLIRDGKVGIVISADTVHEAYAKEFLQDPNRYIKTHKPGYVIITPSCESGVSITERYFTAKYSFFCGVLGTSSQHQMMFRLRDNSINHYVYCPISSQIRDNSIPQGYSEKRIKEALLDRINLSALMCISVSDFVETKNIIMAALERMQPDTWFAYSCKLWAKDNYEKKHLRECLRASLKDAGHVITETQWGICEALDGYMKEIKEELFDREAELQYLAVPYESMEECEKIEKENKDGLTPELRRRIEKTKLILERLPNIDKEECYGVELFQKKLKIRGYISSHQNFSRLQNIAVNWKKQEEDWFYKTTSEYSFIGNLRYPNYTKIAALHDLKILDLIKEEREFTKDSPELVNLFNIVNNSKELLTKLNINKRKVTESKKEVMELFRQLLSFIGIELGKANKKLDSSGIRINHYKIDWDKYNDPIRLSIVKITTNKDSEWLENHQIISWVKENSLDLTVKQLKQQFKSAVETKNYSIYSEAINDVNATKYRSTYGLNSEQVAHNSRIDQAIETAWNSLTNEEQQAIKDLTPAPSNFMDAIDAEIEKTNPNLVGLLPYHKKQSTNKLWKLRLESALAMGKNFVKSLINMFFDSVQLAATDDSIEVFDAYEKVQLEYC